MTTLSKTIKMIKKDTKSQVLKEMTDVQGIDQGQAGYQEGLKVGEKRGYQKGWRACGGTGQTRIKKCKR